MEFIRPPSYTGARVTPLRLFNLYLVRYQNWRGHTRLRGYPLDLAIEATNVCNLRCPACFSGAGRVGREHSMLSMPLYGRLIDELGARLWAIEYHNWGESLLNKNIFDMVEIASRRGISTSVVTHFSLPFDEAKAERLVSSGLSILSASIDGATQSTYASYRVGGDLDVVLRNVQLVIDAKKRLASNSPRLIWSFHIFEHNRHEIEHARHLADSLGMEFAASKAWVVGDDWDPSHDFEPSAPSFPKRCAFLWQRATVNNDGGVAPCHGTFDSVDDYASIDAGGTGAFRGAWNNDAFATARAMFSPRSGDSDRGSTLACAACPAKDNWHAYRRYRASGGTPDKFERTFSMNDGFNYFFSRREGPR